jgi:sugar lactone lactonase YvrE
LSYEGGAYTYELAHDWADILDDLGVDRICGVAVDREDRAYPFNRGRTPVVVLDRDGRYQGSWGGDFRDPHGVHVAPDGSVFLADRDAHVVTKHDWEGTLLMTLGRRDQPSDTGGRHIDIAVPRAAGPFNGPSGIAVAEDGTILVSDGYFNARVHQFGPDGELQASWGSPGYGGPGEFNLVHGLCIDGSGRILVCDRQNHRLQVFDREGNHLATWDGFRKPGAVAVSSDGTVFVAELAHRVTVLDGEGRVIGRWGGVRSDKPGHFTEPHGIAVDSRGDVYVGEVAPGARVQKFIRR